MTAEDIAKLDRLINACAHADECGYLCNTCPIQWETSRLLYGSLDYKFMPELKSTIRICGIDIPTEEVLR